MSRFRNQALACAIAGFAAGAVTQLAHSDPKPPATPNPNPNVVMLHAEKTVTIEKPDLTLGALATELGKQTGYTFKVDKVFATSKTPYAVLCRNTPFSRVLAASGYLNGAKWQRKGMTYTLRPLTATERVIDAERYEGMINRIEAYLGPIDPSDPSLTLHVRQDINGIADWAQRRDDFPLYPTEDQDKWMVRPGSNSLGYSYKSETITANGHSMQMKGGFLGW